MLPTKRNVTSVDQLQKAIQDIKETAASEDLAIHAHDWGQSFSPEVHVLVQEQAASPLMGSLLPHPQIGNLLILL